MLAVSRRVQPITFQAGATIIHEGTDGGLFYIIAQGAAEVVLKRPGGPDVIAERLQPGQFFGEISLFNRSRTVAAVRAVPETPVNVLALDGGMFQSLLAESPDFGSAVEGVVQRRLAQTRSAAGGQEAR
ncbi:MAG: cyclic nucleotide-binding domain-containing protein [Anaerolineae bacterium]|nr:cyclic nucleotide-binding domain-containing protein [Anaerolineae bacterium]